MSEINIKKPATKEELIKILTDAAKKEVETRGLLRRRPTRPTISGTAKFLNVHRDTLYTWLKEFNVDFDRISEGISTNLLSETVELFPVLPACMACFASNFLHFGLWS